MAAVWAVSFFIQIEGLWYMWAFVPEEASYLGMDK